MKKLIATHYDESGKAYKIWIDADCSGDGYIDDADAKQEDLIGNGDFQSPECIEILKECYTKTNLCRVLDLKPTGGNYRQID